MELNDKQIEIIKEASNILDVGYDAEIKNNKIDTSILIDLIEELNSEVEYQKEKYKDLENDLEDNYRPIPLSEQYCISDRDFI